MAHGDRKWFGKPDPYCWLAVVPMVLVSSLVMAFGAVVLGGLGVAAAGLLVTFDSWANRPDQPEGDRRRARGRSPSPDGRRFTPAPPRARSGSAPGKPGPAGRPPLRR